MCHARTDEGKPRVFTHPGTRRFFRGMADFFLPRHRKLLGLPQPPSRPYTGELPHCCAQVKEEQPCACDARVFVCPVHGRHVEPCRPGNSHD